MNAPWFYLFFEREGNIQSYRADRGSPVGAKSRAGFKRFRKWIYRVANVIEQCTADFLFYYVLQLDTSCRQIFTSRNIAIFIFRAECIVSISPDAVIAAREET